MSTPTVIQACAALYGVVPGASFVSTINTELSSVFAGDEDALLNHYYELVFVVNNGNTSEEVAARIVANLGLTGEEATSETTRMAAELEATTVKERGAKVKELIDTFEASGSEAATSFVALKTALVTAVADPTYEGIVGKNVVFSSLNSAQISIGTDESVSQVALVKGVETVAGGAGIDLISGVVSSLTSERTLDSTDVISGGEGQDQITLSMKGDHAFGSAGSMSGIEKVVLNNDTVIGRTFTATNVSDVEAYSINATAGGKVSLASLPEAGISIAVAGQASQALSATFATAAISGSSDELSLTLSDVGTTASVNLDIDGIEVLTLASVGTSNRISLEDSNAGTNDFKTIALSGPAATTLVLNASASRTLDASDATGTLTIADIPTFVTSVIGSQGANTIGTTSATSTLASLIGGSANDSFTVAADSVRADGTIQGGDGADKLVISGGAASTLQLTMSGIETLEIGATTGILTFDGTNVTDLETLKFTSSSMAQSVTLNNLAQADLTAELTGANANTPTYTFTNSGALTINTAQSSSATGAETNAAKITASKAASFDLNVGASTTYNGAVTLGTSTKAVTISVPSGTGTGLGSSFSLTAPGAEDFNVSVAGAIAGSLTATAAKSGTLIYSNSTTDAGTFTLSAAALEQLTVTTSRTFDFSGATLTALQVGTFTSTKGTLTLPSLIAAADLKVTGSGADSALVIGGDIGATTLTYPVAVTVSGFADSSGNTNNVAQAILSGAGVTLNASAATGTLAFGALTGTTSVTVTASGSSKAITTGDLTGNIVTVDASTAGSGSAFGSETATAVTAATTDSDIVGYTVSYNGPNVTASNLMILGNTSSTTSTAMNVTINGGTKTDTFLVKGDSDATTKTITVSGDMGIQTGTEKDAVYVIGTSNASSGAKIDVSNVKNVETLYVDTSAVATTVVGSTSSSGIYTGGAGNDTISGGSSADTIIGGAGGDSLVGGGGNDSFVLTAVTDTAAVTFGSGKLTFTTGAIDIISDFGNGDKLAVKGISSAGLTKYSTTTELVKATLETNITDTAHALIRGTAGSGEFTYSTTGPDSIYLFGGTEYGVILLGYTGASNVSGASTSTAIGVVGSFDLSSGTAINSTDAVTGLLGYVA